MIKVICGWCGKHLRGDPQAPETSHGICEECAAKLLKEFEETQK